jgi:deazaflavin-dependent oxidoreductase (nitroreductase family)
MEAQYLYLTTRGWKTGRAHEIEIWYVEYDARYYLVAENRERTHWVQNVRANPAVTLRIGTRDAAPVEAVGRVVDAAREPELAAAVAAQMDAKYGWSDGTIVEFTPNAG